MTAVNQDYAAVAKAVKDQDRPLAIQLAARALKRGQRHPLILLLAAEGLEARGQVDAAAGLLRAATQAAPTHRVAWMRLAALLARLQKFEEAGAAFDQVLLLDPDFYPALMGAGEMRLLLRDLPMAERHYRRAMAIRPGAAEPLAVLASMAAQERNTAEARALAARAQAIEPGLLGAEMAIARADLLEGAPAPAEARLTSLLGRPGLDDSLRVGILDVRATALDALNRPSDAYADYEARNAILLRQHAPRFGAESAGRPSDMARRLNAFITEMPIVAAPEPVDEAAPADRVVRRHVILLGFPRSGTTLLEKVLAGHPEVVTLEEINHLAAAGNHLGNGANDWRRRATLTRAEADACREIYWRGVRQSIAGDLSDKILIDKLPLHTLVLPLIAKLFPDARILFALRDPRDVVLSCYRRRFQVNSAMFEFLTLPGAADFYDVAMTLATTARTRLRLNVHEVRHEAVIADFDGEIGKILAFVGADWDPAVRTFAERVGGRVRTPSYPQLARGLNADGVGQWRRYASQIAPVLAVLEPWVERFGYQSHI